MSELYLPLSLTSTTYALMGLSAIYAKWGATLAVTAVFAGLAPAVLAIVSQAVSRIGRRALNNRFLIALAVVAFVALFFFDVPFPVVIAAAGLAGYVADGVRPGLLARKGGATPDTGPAPLISDDSLHGERPSWSRAAKILAVGLVLWATPVVVATLTLGRHHVFVVQGVFFSGTAVVTFGGAYAVLSFVAERAVTVYHWLLPGEMVNGLALAETTPGPLIMVVQFVGFLGAYRNPGDLSPWVAGVVGSTLVVWVTFVPCFLFVFLGAPHIEGLRQNAKLSAALSGITAAVVGVITNLSVYFSMHTLFVDVRVVDSGPVNFEIPAWGTVSPRALAVSVLAFILVFRYKVAVLKVLGICALAGAGFQLCAQ